jgi:haloacid dehalogenase-like hydrolase
MGRHPLRLVARASRSDPECVRVGPLHQRLLHRLREPAVANAHPDVVAAADEVTASNDQDGVVLVLERLAISKLTAKPASSPGNVPCASVLSLGR